MQKPPFASGQPDPGCERIKETLDAILATDKFQAAPQMSAFLRYVVEQTASGNQNRIKAYTVAVDALGKPDTFDPQNDPVVRVLAGRLRSTLTAYFEAHADADVIIEMRPGSYVPSFVYRDAANVQEATSAPAARHSTDGVTLPASTSLPNAEAGAEPDDATHDRTAAEPTQADGQNPFNASALRYLPGRFPQATAVAALIAIALTGVLINEPESANEPAMQAGSPVNDQSTLSPPLRSRPDMISLFISAMEPTDSLESQLNTLISGVFSESEKVRVHRILERTQVRQYWPEDYLVSLNVDTLAEATRVSVQLVDAQTGQVNHSEILHLSADAAGGLSHDELNDVINVARRLISDDGPLFMDYRSKLDG